MKKETKRRFWTEKEIKKLRNLIKKQIRIEEIAKILNRSNNAINNKYIRLDLKRDKKISNKIKKTNWKNPTWNEKERRRKIRFGHLGNKNPMWKGDKVGIKGLHIRIKNLKPKPKFCVRCKKNKPYDLSNISGKYKRDIKDFEWLCRRCHMKSDGRLKKFKKMNRKFLKGLK